MFAGLPGIGVGTLFYVLAAFWMPFMELGRVVRGTSSVARWRRIAVQWAYAFSIILSIIIADRVMLWALGAATPGSLSPARLLHGELGARAPHSLLAAPMTASLILLAVVLLTVEISRWRQRYVNREPRPLAGEVQVLGRPERTSTPFLDAVRDGGNEAAMVLLCAGPAAMLLLRAA